MAKQLSIKRRVMAITGWTSKEYKRKYDVVANRVKNYVTLHPQANVEPANLLLLYREEARVKGETLSKARQQVLYETTASSPGKLSEREKRFKESYREDYFKKEIEKQFGVYESMSSIIARQKAEGDDFVRPSGIVNVVTEAREIWENPDLSMQKKYKAIKEIATRIDRARHLSHADKSKITEKEINEAYESFHYEF